MKKVFMLLLVFALAICLAACDDSPNAPSAPSAGAVSESVAEEAPEDEMSDSAASDSVVTGTVVFYDGTTLAVCSLDNTNLHFLVADEEIDQDEARGLAVGSEADVYYTGRISGSNTSAARVTKLAQSPEQSAVRPDVNVTGGVITGSDASEFSIISFDGKALIFLIAGEGIDMEHTNGLTTDDYVTVFYEGEIGSGNGSSVKVVKVVQ